MDILQKFLRNLINDGMGIGVPNLKKQGPVKEVASNNFNDIVVNNGRDTLIEFYAPWCIYCKRLEPIYEELAVKMKDEDVDIVKMDAYNHKHIPSQYDVRGFPTVYFARMDAKSTPIRFTGRRDVNNFILFIAMNSSKELKGWDRKGKPKK